MKSVFKCIVCFILTIIFSTTFLIGCDKKDNGGNEVDLKLYPNYVDKDLATYKFEEKEMVTPFFKGNIIYNETVMLIDDEDGHIEGKLQYKPVKILSIRDYSWEKEYDISDFEIKDRTISLKNTDSDVPYLIEANYSGAKMLTGYQKVNTIATIATDCVQMGPALYTESPLYYGHQISVSYVYDVKDLDMSLFPSYKTSGLTKTKVKLALGEDLKVVACGDSVMEGCSSSKKYNHKPYMDNFMDQSMSVLDKEYSGNITFTNKAVGGKTSGWGAEVAQTSAVKALKPDLVYIHFGVNDCGSHNPIASFKANYITMIEEIKNGNVDCEIVLIKGFNPNPDIYDETEMKSYWDALDEVASQKEDVYVLDVATFSKKLVDNKKYQDITANGINHVNDYTSRLYTMFILSQLIDY